MLYRNHAGDKPVVAASATIHPSAVVIGNVQIGSKNQCLSGGGGMI
jgi:carbonic anhydrase/acetyltransferase-like protein (isoleucine patch superfamily)